MKMQTRIFLFCGNVLLFAGQLIDTSHPTVASYLKGFAAGAIIGAALNYFFDWLKQGEQKAMEAIENNLTNNL